MNEKPKGAGWHCFKCKVETEISNVMISFRGVTDVAKSLRCPKCGARYIPEDSAVEVIVRLEDYIDRKEA